MDASQYVARSRDRRPVGALALSLTLVALSLVGCAMDAGNDEVPAGSDEVPAETVSTGARLVQAARAPGVKWQRLKMTSATKQYLTVTKDEQGNVVSSCQRAPMKMESSKP